MTSFVQDYDRTDPSRTASLEFHLVSLFTDPDGANFTDLHIEEDEIIMGRIGSNDWVPALDNDAKPIRIRRGVIENFLNDMYKSDPHPSVRGDQPGWAKRLREHYSLHPSMTMEVENGNGVPRSIRVRMTVILHQIGTRFGLMCRALRDVPKSVESLGLPVQVSKMARANSGLILVTGPTGAGKTTSIAAMINEINESRAANVVTIEDPVEFVHARKKSIINHREIGVDVRSFADGVKDALRFVPDVVMLGEIRDEETMRAAVRAAESGHLVLSTMHAPSTINAVRKCLSYLNSPAERMSFATSLVGIVTQALIVAPDGSKHLAYETLDARESAGKPMGLQSAIISTVMDSSASALTDLERAHRDGKLEPSAPMISSLLQLVKQGKVSVEKAAIAAHHPDDVKALLDMR